MYTCFRSCNYIQGMLDGLYKYSLYLYTFTSLVHATTYGVRQTGCTNIHHIGILVQVQIMQLHTGYASRTVQIYTYWYTCTSLDHATTYWVSQPDCTNIHYIGIRLICCVRLKLEFCLLGYLNFILKSFNPCCQLLLLLKLISMFYFSNLSIPQTCTSTMNCTIVIATPEPWNLFRTSFYGYWPSPVPLKIGPTITIM